MCSFSVRATLVLLLACVMSSFSFAEPIMLGSTAVNTVQIKALKQRGKKVFEIQLGGGSNQPPANTMIAGRAFIVLNREKYAGYYRLSTDPNRQLKMKLKSTARGTDNYAFMTKYDVLYFEFGPTRSFNNPWITGRITTLSATQRMVDSANQNNANQNGNHGDGEQNNGDMHPPILLIGKIGSSAGGSMAKSFRGSDSQLLLNVGGNQRLSVLTPGNTHSGMKLEQGSYSPSRKN